MIRRLDQRGQIDPLPLNPEVEIPSPDLGSGLHRHFPIEYARTGSRRDREYLSGAVLCFVGAVILFYVFFVR